MQKSIAINTKGTVKAKDFPKLNQINSTVIILSLIGFLLSRAVIVDAVAPLGIAYYLYISRVKKYSIPVFLSVALGIMSTGNIGSHTIKYMAALVLIGILTKPIRNITSIFKVAFIGLVVMIISAMGQAVISGSYMYDVIVALFEGLAVFALVYIYSFGVPLIIKRDMRESISNEEVIALSVLITLSIMGIGNIDIFGISIQKVLSTLLILIFAYTGGASLGASTGVVIGLATIVNDISSSLYIGIYSFAGLLSGGFSKVNKYLSICGYIIGWSIIMICTQGTPELISSLREVVLASLIMLLIPNEKLTYIEKFTKGVLGSYQSANDHIKRAKEITNSRLISMYKTYGELADTFDKIREKDRILDQKDIASVIDMIQNDECRQCGMKRSCWDMKFNHTYTAFTNILQILEERGKIDYNNLPYSFNKSCIKPESVVKTANHYFKLFALDYDWNQRLVEARRLVSNQIRCISTSIEDLANDLQTGMEFDLQMENDILVELDRNNIGVNKLNFLRKENDDFEITIEKETCYSGSMCDEKLVNIISEIVGCKLSAQKVGCSSIGDRCKVTLSKAQEYNAVTEVAYMSKDGHIYCGDNYTYMEIFDGKYMAALSDGMGKGKKAFEQSSVTIDILEKMMESRIKEELTIDTINNMLMLKSSEEMFSTLDLSIIDLKQGELETVKMGACSTFIKRDRGNVEVISSSSLPVGIISEVKVDRDKRRIKDGDYIIMMSDGIVDAGKDKNLGDNWLYSYIDKINTTNPKEISKMILNYALDIQDGNIQDDMTVLVTKICKN